jgi:pimeloyl-ACP methyl ester carboxylesterase
MTSFALIHGGMHGAWCWSLLEQELRADGHETATVELPAEDPDAGVDVYASVCLEAFTDLSDDVVVVGHSTGGLTVPVVAERRPVGRMVFLCALIPKVGMSVEDQLVEEPDINSSSAAMGGRHISGGVHRRDPASAKALFFDDVDDELAEWAVAQLRPQATKPLEEVSPLRTWPDVPSTYVMGRADRCINPAWARREVPRRLGVTPVELDGGHSPFLARPRALADVLAALPV